jgi:hypothetical protein
MIEELNTEQNMHVEDQNIETNQQTVNEENLQQQTQEKPKQEGPTESFRALRAKAERIERERDDAIRKLKESESKYRQPEEDDEIRLNPDDLAEGKHLTKVANKIRKLEDQLKNYQQQSNEYSIESKIKTQYPDFDKVVTKDTVELLTAAYPELAHTLNSSPDLYSKAVSAYTLIKKFGIQPEEPYSEEKERAIRNSVKPKPLASISPQQGESPLSRANAFSNGLTEDLKAQLYKEMMEHRKSY